MAPRRKLGKAKPLVVIDTPAKSKSQQQSSNASTKRKTITLGPIYTPTPLRQAQHVLDTPSDATDTPSSSVSYSSSECQSPGAFDVVREEDEREDGEIREDDTVDLSHRAPKTPMSYDFCAPSFYDFTNPTPAAASVAVDQWFDARQDTPYAKKVTVQISPRGSSPAVITKPDDDDDDDIDVDSRTSSVRRRKSETSTETRITRDSPSGSGLRRSVTTTTTTKTSSSSVKDKVRKFETEMTTQEVVTTEESFDDRDDVITRKMLTGGTGGEENVGRRDSEITREMVGAGNEMEDGKEKEKGVGVVAAEEVETEDHDHDHDQELSENVSFLSAKEGDGNEGDDGAIETEAKTESDASSSRRSLVKGEGDAFVDATAQIDRILDDLGIHARHSISSHYHDNDDHDDDVHDDVDVDAERSNRERSDFERTLEEEGRNITDVNDLIRINQEQVAELENSLGTSTRASLRRTSVPFSQISPPAPMKSAKKKGKVTFADSEPAEPREGDYDDDDEEEKGVGSSIAASRSGRSRPQPTPQPQRQQQQQQQQQQQRPARAARQTNPRPTIPTEFEFATDRRARPDEHPMERRSHKAPIPKTITTKATKAPTTTTQDVLRRRVAAGPSGVTKKTARKAGGGVGKKNKKAVAAATAKMDSVAASAVGLGSVKEVTVPKPFHFRSKASGLRGVGTGAGEDGQPPASPYVPLAIKVKRALEATPERFKAKPIQKAIGKLLVHSLTRPKSPKLTTKNRTKHQLLIPTEERLAQEVKVSANMFKAKPVNPKIFESQGDLGVPKIAKTDLTIPISPVFTKRRPRPFFVTDTPPTKPPRKILPLRKTKKAAAPWVPELPAARITIPEPFHLPGDAIHAAARRDMDDSEARRRLEEDARRNFKAHALPDHIDDDLASIDEVLRAQKLRRKRRDRHHLEERPEVVIVPKPFQFRTDARGEEYWRRFNERVREEEAVKEKENAFRAQPAPGKDKKAFVPRKSDKPLTEVAEGFVLNSEVRAEERRAFDDEIRMREALEDELREARKVEDEQREKIEVRNLRDRLVHHANPVRHFTDCKPHPSEKELTLPRSPAFVRRKRRRDATDLD